MTLLTDKPFIAVLDLNDIIHVVDVDDLSGSPQGTSKAMTLTQLKTIVDSDDQDLQEVFTSGSVGSTAGAITMDSTAANDFSILQSGTGNIIMTATAGNIIFTSVQAQFNNDNFDVISTIQAAITSSGTGTVALASNGSGDVFITANTGRVKIEGLTYPNADGTLNYVLKTDGGGILSFADVDTLVSASNGIYDNNATIGTTRAAGITDNITFGTNLLFLDETNTQVGINTNTVTAGYTLEVQGRASFISSATHQFEVSGRGSANPQSVLISQQDQTVGATHAAGLQFSSQGTDAVGTRGFADVRSYIQARGVSFISGGLIFSTTANGVNSTSPLERMRITELGDVSIGAGAPSARLDVWGVGTTNATYNFKANDSAGVTFFGIRDDGSWSLGEGSTPNTNATVVIGLNSTGNHAASVIIGNAATDAIGSTREQIVIGNNASTTGTGAQKAVIIGASATGIAGAIAIGESATTTTLGGVAIGRSSDAQNGVAIGNVAQALVNGGIAIGGSTSVGDSYGIAIGLAATNTGQDGISIGHTITNTGVNSIAIGENITTATGTQGIAIGLGANQASSFGIAIGPQASVGNAGSANMSLGYYCTVGNSGNETFALGAGAESDAAGAFAIGRATSPSSNKMTNTTVNSVGFGWEELTPSILFAKTADMFINGAGNLAIGSATSNDKLDVTGNVRTSGHYKVGTVQVLGAQATGWGAPTGTETRTTFDTATVTLPQLAERVHGLIDDLTGHGMIGA